MDLIDFQGRLMLAVLIPVFGAFLLPFLGRVRWLRNGLALLLTAAPLVISLSLIPWVMAGDVVSISYDLPLGMNIAFAADGLAVFMAVVSSFISSLIVLYSFDYISHYEHQTEYYLMVVLFLGSMMGLTYAANLILLFVFWELTAIASWRLIGFFRAPRDVVRADKAFLVTVFGALLMLLGFIMLAEQAGSFDMAVIHRVMDGRTISNIAALLILAGLLSKSATLPFHTWLPDAGVAPSPVTALLHAAVLVKIGVYAFARLFLATVSLEPVWQTVVPVIAGASALIAAGAALMDTDLKRIIAYSTISQIGFIFLGLALDTTVGIVGGLLYIMMHGLAKAGLFLCAGIVEQNTKTKDVTSMGGLVHTMPMTALAFLLCSFSVMGIPPFGGFFSKYLVISAALGAGHPWIALLFTVGAVLTILYLLRTFMLVFMGESRGCHGREGSRLMVACVVSLAVLSLAGGLLIQWPEAFARQAASMMQQGMSAVALMKGF